MIPQHATLEISRSRLQHNLNLLQSHLGPATKICAAVKANAYGHGLAPLCQLLCASNIHWAAVYSLDEALQLLALPDTQNLNILTLAPFVAQSPDQFHDILPLLSDPRLRINITDEATARALSEALIARKQGAPATVKVHVQIDTGLTRAGTTPSQAHQLLELIMTLPNLHLEGIFAHFSHADVPGHPTIHEQADRFHALADPWKKRFPQLLLHLQNSAAALHSKPTAIDIARIGIALYGLQPSTAYPIADLQPIARMTAPILAIHDTPANTGVGYGHTFITTRPSRLAIVPAGYAEGYPRSFSNHAVAQLQESDIPLVGRISMDQIILDITDLPSAKLGDSVTLISWNTTNPNSLDRMADAAGTIGYELATHFGPRLHRVIVD